MLPAIAARMTLTDEPCESIPGFSSRRRRPRIARLPLIELSCVAWPGWARASTNSKACIPGTSPGDDDERAASPLRRRRLPAAGKGRSRTGDGKVVDAQSRRVGADPEFEVVGGD